MHGAAPPEPYYPTNPPGVLFHPNDTPSKHKRFSYCSGVAQIICIKGEVFNFCSYLVTQSRIAIAMPRGFPNISFCLPLICIAIPFIAHTSYRFLDIIIISYIQAHCKCNINDKNTRTSESPALKDTCTMHFLWMVKRIIKDCCHLAKHFLLFCLLISGSGLFKHTLIDLWMVSSLSLLECSKQNKVMCNILDSLHGNFAT